VGIGLSQLGALLEFDGADELLSWPTFYGLDHARFVVAPWIAPPVQRRTPSALDHLNSVAYAARLAKGLRRQPDDSPGSQRRREH